MLLVNCFGTFLSNSFDRSVSDSLKLTLKLKSSLSHIMLLMLIPKLLYFCNGAFLILFADFKSRSTAIISIKGLKDLHLHFIDLFIYVYRLWSNLFFKRFRSNRVVLLFRFVWVIQLLLYVIVF